MDKMKCPNGWDDCKGCVHERSRKIGCPTDEEPIIMASRIAEKSVSERAKESAEKIKGMQEDYDWWGWWAKSSPPSLHTKEALPLDGPSAPGGGSKSNVKKQPKGCKPTIYKWGEFK